jgi:twitching motility protein PilT
MANLHELLKTLVEAGGSDLHITTNTPPHDQGGWQAQAA